MSKDIKPLQSRVLDTKFTSDNEDEVTSARIVRELYAKSKEEKWGLMDEALLPGILTTQVQEAIQNVRKLLEKKEDGQTISFGWGIIPCTPPLSELDTDVCTFISNARNIYIFMADLISDEIGCKYSFKPAEFPLHEQICFH